MRRSRFVVVALLALVVAAAASASTRMQSATLAAPTGLHGFLLRADAPAQDTFTRTPSFAWKPAAGAQRYEFQLATSRTFAAGAVLARKTTTAPAVALPIALPWISGTPYSLYSRVRGIAPDGTTGPWSELYGFNMRWSTLPTPMSAPDGLIRWTTVDGATAYQVWYLDPNKIVKTTTNVADEREYYTFHKDPTWTGVVRWRIRAVRALYGLTGGDQQNGLPATSYGPWSPTYTSTNTPFVSGPLSDVEAISDVISTATKARAHHLMPAFVFSGDTSMYGPQAELYRVYVATDRDCVNIVFRGAVVGGPAYAPRWNGTLALPQDDIGEAADRSLYVAAGSEGLTTMLDGTPVVSNEAVPPAAADTAAITSGEDDSPPGPDAGSAATGAKPAFPPATLAVDATDVGPPVDLWDTGWPEGRYYWTVVPVEIVTKPPLSTTLSALAASDASTITVTAADALAVGDVLLIGTGPAQESVTVVSVSGSVVTVAPALKNTHGAGDVVVRAGGSLSYRDLELPQDACAAGRVMSFGKTSQPALASTNALPFASGLSPHGRLVSAPSSIPAFYGAPLVSWQPALGASAYEVQWSKVRYPFTAATTPILTYGTSAVLPLTPGRWWYRVRGINLGLPAGARAMAWSASVSVIVAKPKFAVIRK